MYIYSGEEGREWGGVYSINNKTDNITKALSDERPNFGVLAENYDKGLLNIGEIPMKTLKEMVATLSEMNVINPDPNQIIAHPTIIPEYIKVINIYWDSVNLYILSIWAHLICPIVIAIYLKRMQMKE